MTRPLVVLAAGGTGGHMFPAEALARVPKDVKIVDIVKAISGSIKRGAGDSTSSAASDSVMLWPIVNDVTINASLETVPPSSNSPIRNRM